MKPLALALLLCVLCAPLFAQDFSPIGNTNVAGNAAWIAHYTVDHGASPQAVTIDVSVTTASNSGLRVRILDTDDKSVAGSNDEASGLQLGPGTADAQLVTAARSGVHDLLVIVQPAQPGGSLFNGSVQTSAGGLTLVTNNQTFAASSGLFIPFGLYAAFNGELSTTASFTTNVVVDFGAAPQAMTFVFEGIGTGMNELRIYDVSGGNVLLKTLSATVNGNLASADFVTTPVYAGQVEFRVEVEGDGSAGDIFWAMWTPNTVSVVGGSGDGVSAPSSGGGGGGGGGCAAEHGRSFAAFALPLLAILFLRRGTRRPCGCRATAGRG
ncbi:MAG: hypothetical protein H6841_06365 [Planctomycetes bacterium]|nr:hypothetical protein [Planctomycetota bacterium]MCB9936053.1 hypothetical protein [Planctomycetota bacterium]